MGSPLWVETKSKPLIESNHTAEVGKMDMLFLVCLYLLEHLCEVFASLEYVTDDCTG